MTLAKIDAGGGMSPEEIIGNINFLAFRDIIGMNRQEAVKRLQHLEL